MTGRRRVWTAISAMETDLANIERWGLVLTSMGTSCNVDPDAVFVVGDALVDVGRRLRNEFDTALEVARQAEAKPCA